MLALRVCAPVSGWRSFCRALERFLLFFLTLENGYRLAAGQMTFCALLVSPYAMASLLASPPCSSRYTLFRGCACSCTVLRGSTIAAVQSDWTADSQSCMMKTLEKYFPGSVLCYHCTLKKPFISSPINERLCCLFHSIPILIQLRQQLIVFFTGT